MSRDRTLIAAATHPLAGSIDLQEMLSSSDGNVRLISSLSYLGGGRETPGRFDSLGVRSLAPELDTRLNARLQWW